MIDLPLAEYLEPRAFVVLDNRQPILTHGSSRKAITHRGPLTKAP